MFSFDFGRFFSKAQAAVLPFYPPVDYALTMLADGDTAHAHDFKEVPWEKKLGRECVGIDKDFGGKLEFPMLTMRTLFKCSCGAKGIHSERSLI